MEHDGATEVKRIDVDRTNKRITTTSTTATEEDQYNATTTTATTTTSAATVSSQETTTTGGMILDNEYSGHGVSPLWSQLQFGGAAGRMGMMMLESASLSKRGQKPDAAAPLPNSSLHQEPVQWPLSPQVEGTNERSSEKDPVLVDCVGHWKQTNGTRKAHEEKVLDSSAKFLSEDLPFNHPREQKGPPTDDSPCSEETVVGRLSYASLRRDVGHREIPTIRQFDSKEVRVVKDSSFQEQEQQVFTSDEDQISTPHKGLSVNANLKTPHATQSVLPFPPNLNLSMQRLAKRAFQFNADEPSSQNMYGGQDVLDFETSKYSSMWGEVDPCGGMGLKSRSQSVSYKFGSSYGKGIIETQALDGGQISGLHPTAYDFPQPLPETSRPNSVQVHKSYPPHFQGQYSGYSQHPLLMESPKSSYTWSSKGYHKDNQTGGGHTLAPVGGQSIYHQRLRINTTWPEPNEQLRVVCRHCSLHLQVPPNMPDSDTGYQKLRCGACRKISRFLLYPSYSSAEDSPAASSENLSPAVPDQFFPPVLDGLSVSRRNRDTDSNHETGLCDREVQTHSVLPLPPGIQQLQGLHGSKLSHMFTAPATSDQSTPSSSEDLGSPEATMKGQGRSADSLEDTRTHVSCTPALSTVDHDLDIAATDGLGSNQDRQQLQDLKYLGSTSDSEDDERASIPMSMAAPRAVDLPEVKGLRGFLKRSMKELTKAKDVSQFRRKVIVNGHAVPDAIVEKAEDLAGPIHPGSYWYDVRAGFWGLMDGPCLGMIPPFIEVLNYPLARHCSNGKTGVLVNRRELHLRDLELLKQRGLPGIPGKSYNLDIDGCLFDAVTGTELPGLGHLAPTLERTVRGPGMGVLRSSLAS